MMMRIFKFRYWPSTGRRRRGLCTISPCRMMANVRFGSLADISHAA